MTSGETLGHYRIEAKLGQGGMGEVYRAADTKLGRDVAIKVLREGWARDPERLARFEREAKVLASLNHPNIAAIYGFEQVDGVPFLVLEYVPGETLRGPMPVEEALAVARQITEALEAAHEKGIVHRDLKPANVKITPEGKVKVLDFGLAKAYADDPASSDPAASPTISVLPTRAGTILGTAGYMSPEQVRGKPLDKRTDIWAFGCVLYEVLTGRKAFAGETITDCMAAVLNREPEWEALPAETPAHVRTLLRRCLQKEAQKRLRDIGDARMELEAPLEPVPAAVRSAPRERTMLVGVACVVAGAIVAGLIGWRVWRRPLPPPPVARFTITLPPGEILSPQSQSSVAISPDGARLAWVANRAGRTLLYWRPLDRQEAKPISGTENAVGPVFSPDGQWLAFLQAARWKKVALSGGAPVTICDAPPGAYMYAAWGADDNLLIGVYPASVLQVPASGGAPRPLFAADSSKGERAYWMPHILPGGKGVLFTIRTAEMDSYDDGPIAVQPLPAGQRKILLEGGYKPSYSPSGHMVYAPGRTVARRAVRSVTPGRHRASGSGPGRRVDEPG